MARYLVFSLVAISLLSVFINGLSAGEISYVEHDVTGATNENDVEGLAALQSQFVILQLWGGDPCISLLPWTWVQCTNDPTPRITALYLNNSILTGPLPDFSSMDALETIDLSNNNLTGPIPDFLGTLPNLQVLNLVNNDFQGAIPASLLNNEDLDLMVTGNANLCESCEETSIDTPSTYSDTPHGEEGNEKKKNMLPIVLGILIPVFILFWIVVAVFAISHHKRKSATMAAMVAGTSNIPEMKGQEGSGGARNLVWGGLDFTKKILGGLNRYFYDKKKYCPHLAPPLQEGEINMATRMDQQGNTYTNPEEHVNVPYYQPNVNP